jgi:hypothetical protein
MELAHSCLLPDEIMADGKPARPGPLTVPDGCRKRFCPGALQKGAVSIGCHPIHVKDLFYVKGRKPLGSVFLPSHPFRRPVGLPVSVGFSSPVKEIKEATHG